jgi:DNA-binding MarR family transcriptional regulator
VRVLFEMLGDQQVPVDDRPLLAGLIYATRATRLLDSLLSKVLAPLRMEQSEMMTLLTLWVRGSPHRAVVSDLTEAALLTPSGMSRAIARLGDRGMLISSPDARDGRVRVIELTPVGLAVARDMIGELTAAVREQFAGAHAEFQLRDVVQSLVYLCSALDASDTAESIDLGDGW